MKRWHSEQALMRRRWKDELLKHSPSAPIYGPYLPKGNVRYILGVKLQGPECHCEKGPGFFRKRRPDECSNPRCPVCHYDKYYANPWKTRRKREWRAERRIIGLAYGLQYEF